ncbi:MAG TPA: DUF3592 domain-containing protein [Thermoanaerobaculia bacterium]|nr:DUF3592 domain-containing protein [Thermoanaerobaculia bacterium]
MTSRRLGVPGSILFAVAGCGVLFGAYKWNAHERAFYATAIHTTGRVTELVPKQDKDGTQFAPRVLFSDVDGHSISFVSSVSSKPAAYNVGDSVKVVYSPNLPQNAEVDSFFNRWGLVSILGFMGAVFVFLGIGSIVSRVFSGGL